METPDEVQELALLLSRSWRIAQELDELLRLAYTAMLRMAEYDEDAYFHLAEVARHIDAAFWDLNFRDIDEH
jgi:hypothetical protein